MELSQFDGLSDLNGGVKEIAQSDQDVKLQKCSTEAMVNGAAHTAEKYPQFMK